MASPKSKTQAKKKAAKTKKKPTPSKKVLPSKTPSTPPPATVATKKQTVKQKAAAAAAAAKKSHMDDMAEALSRLHADTDDKRVVMSAAIRDSLGFPTPEEEADAQRKALEASIEADRKIELARSARIEDFVIGFDAIKAMAAYRSQRDTAAERMEVLLLKQASLASSFDKVAARLDRLDIDGAVAIDEIKAICNDVFHIATLEAIMDVAEIAPDTRKIIVNARSTKLFGPTPTAPPRAPTGGRPLTAEDLKKAVGAFGDRRSATDTVTPTSRFAMANRPNRRGRTEPFGLPDGPSDPFGVL